MKILRGIPDALAGEHVLRTVPPIGPYARAAAGAAPLRVRLNLFPQRALTHTALTAEQHSRIADAMRLGQSVAPGVVKGFEAALDDASLVIAPGHAIAPDGQDIELAYTLRLRFDEVPVASPLVDAALAEAHAGPQPWPDLSGLQRLATLRQVLDTLAGAAWLPRAMALVAMPLSIALDRSEDTGSPCPNATDSVDFSHAAWEDGFQLAWAPWPADRTLPPWSADGSRPDPRWRNRLAYAVFQAERQRLSQARPRSMRAWAERAALSETERDALAEQAAAEALMAAPWPWELLGVPLALVGFDAGFVPMFADRAAVVRQGGGRRNRSALVPASGDDVLWQARVSQQIEHLSELPPEQRQAAALARSFDWLPPAGVLPRDAVDFVSGRQSVFPPGFDVQAQAVPLDMVDALIAESAPMAPFNLSLRDQVQVLVPVPARHFDPDLLQLDPTIHPLFDLEIARLGGERLQLLTERDGQRRRYDVLSQAVAGQLPSYPQDDPNALPDETGTLDAMAFQRVHRSRVDVRGAELHGFSGAHVTLGFEAADELIVFVRLDSAPAGIGVRPLISSELNPDAPVTRPFVWGSAPADANGDRLGDLPAVGEWVKLSVPMSRAGLGGLRIDGLAFATFGGDAAGDVLWGYAGKAASGREVFWLTDALPPGAVADAAEGWVWVTQGEGASPADDLALGVPIEEVRGDRPHVRHVSEIERLLANWAGFRDGALMVELGEPTDGKRTVGTPPRTVDAGLDALITRLDARIRAAGDHIDFGFMRARTDIFRLRQSLLGTADAGRFLTSAAAADLVLRNENPVATEKEFADYFKRLSELPAEPPSFTPTKAPEAARSPPAPQAARTPTAAAAATMVDFAFAPAPSPLLFKTPPPPPLVFAAPAPSPAIMMEALKVPGVSPEVSIRIDPTATKEVTKVAEKKPVPLAADPPPLVSDVSGASLIGATYNTVTVAERFTSPAAVVASNSAAKGKNDFVVTGLKGLQGGGLVVDDLPVFGYQKLDDEGNPLPVNARDLLDPAARVVDIDGQDIAEGDVHEAVYFRRGIDALDNTVRFLRSVELRAEDYRRLQADARAVRQRIADVLKRLGERIGGLGVQLSEVRHDLAVARALRDEEGARLAAVVARRQAVLAEQVPFLVFRRPRLTLSLNDVPLLPAQPAAIPDPVPLCRAEAQDPPPELTAMVDTLRDLPVRWLKPVSQAFVKLDRVVQVDRVLALSRDRLQRQAVPLAVQLMQTVDSAAAIELGRSFERQGQRVLQAQAGAAAQLASLQVTTWRQAIEPLQHIVSVRDLTQLGGLPREVTLAAAGLLDDVGGVAACLHAALCQVPPATRLRWAELFSQLDPAVSLRVMTVLPGFGQVSAEVDAIAWRQMQAMTDWLFAQVAPEAEATAAVNDLVRVCVLLAAHAPVRRILSARIRRPVPAVVGTRLEIDIDPYLTRIGMQVLVQAPGRSGVLARAVVEDLGSAMATARITHSSAPAGTTLDASLRVQVQTGPAYTTAARQQSESAWAHQAAVPAATAAPAPARSAAPAPPAAEQRVAQQVEKLAGLSLVGWR